MKKGLAVISIVMLLAACDSAGGVTTTSIAPVESSIATATSTTPPELPEVTETTTVTSTTIELGLGDEAAVTELETVLYEIEHLVNDTEALLEEPLPLNS